MTARLAAASLTLALIAGMALGQSAPAGGERPPEKPLQAEAGVAPPERPAEAGAVEAETVEAGPVEAPPAQTVDDTPPAERPAITPAATPDTAAGGKEPLAGLIPPEETVAPAPPEEPKGPPIRETLRESDFDHSACLLALHGLGAEYEELSPLTQPDQRDCGIARPIRVTEILPGIALQGGAAMRCDTARALGFWMHDFVRPAAARLPDAPRLSGMQLGTTYDCRGRVGDQADAKLSEHAFGNAIDISAFTFLDGPTLPVEPRQDSGDLVEAFQRAVRGAACLEFTTVLGPGSNSSHNDHLHLDIAARKGGWRLCQ